MAWRIVFMGSDPIALPMLEAIRDGRCGPVEVIAIYTQPDRPRGRGKKIAANEIKRWALEKGIPVFQPERMRKRDRLDIEAMEADAIVVMAFGHMLSQALIDTPAKGIWNLHTSLLPKYRGASPIQCAVASGERETGVSLMKVVLETDAGPVLDVERVNIGKLDTALDIDHALGQASVPLVERNLVSILEGTANAVAQDESLAIHVRKLTKADGELDFSTPAKALAQRINGLFPWPGSRFVWNGTSVKLGLADYDESSPESVAGEVIGLERRGLAVACGSGTLFLKRMQRPGGKMLDAESFLRGFDLPKGSVLESHPMSPLLEASQ